MAILEIIKFPDERLRNKAVPVGTIDDKMKKIAMDMIETMYHANGVGLAAIQVGIPYRLIVIDIEHIEHDAHPLICFNPEIISAEGREKNDEGCLSVPGFTAPVIRFSKVVVRYTDLEGSIIEVTAEDLLSRAFQHEIDHLDGIVFVDHLSRIRRELFLKRLKKSMEQNL